MKTVVLTRTAVRRFSRSRNGSTRQWQQARSGSQCGPRASTSPAPWRGWVSTPLHQRRHASWAMRWPAKSEIFGTASASKYGAIQAHGVHHPIDYRSQDFKAEVRRLTDGEGVDIVMDAIGPTSFRKDYRILRPGGRLIMYGLSEALNENGRTCVPP